MMEKQNKLIASTSITIRAKKEEVWKAITTSETISQYLMGTTVKSDWKVGSKITYEGKYDGKAYKDKGEILQFEPNRIFKSTYWSSMGGKADLPENYNTVTYSLSEDDGKTKLRLSQSNVNSMKEKEHATANWKMTLKKLKEIVENS